MTNLEAVMMFAREYAQSDSPRPTVKDGIDFYCVGHNASHWFYLGVDAEGAVWKYSVGEGDYDENDVMQYDEYVRRVGNIADMGYVGHY